MIEPSNSTDMRDDSSLQQRIAELEAQLHQQQVQLDQLKLYQQLVDVLPIPIQIYHPDGLMLTMNHASEEFWQATCEQVAGKFNVVQDPQFRAQGVPFFFQQAVDGEYVQTPPTRLDTSQLELDRLGSVIKWIIADYLPVRDDTGTVQYVVVTNRDVTTEVERLAELEEIQTRLEESESLFKGLIAYSPSPIFIKDTNGIVIVANEQIERFFHLEPGSMAGKTVYDLMPQEMAENIWQSELQVIQTGKSLLVEEIVQAPDGLHVLMTSKFPIYNQQNELYAIGGIITDITDQRQAEEQLRMTQIAVDKSADCIFLINYQAQLAYVNDIACTALQYTREELLQKTVADVDPDFPMSQWHAFWHEIKTHTNKIIQSRHRRKDGTLFPVEIRLNFFAYMGKDYIYAFARDITERKQVEDELRRYAAVIEAGIDGVAMASPNRKTLLVNPAFRKMIGAGLDDDLATINMDNVHPEWAHRIINEVAMPIALRDGAWAGETAMLNRVTGEEIPVSQVLMVHRLPDGTLDFLSTIMRDIRYIKAAEVERATLQQQIIDAQQHAIRELSTPLIPLSKNVILMPLVGNIDSRRAQLVMETLLEGIASYQAETAILDITGVSVVDTQVANALVQTARAVQLLGAQVVLTGIGPTMAQTLVHLGADLSTITTRGSLQRAIVDALYHTS